ncbi:type II toxin-antitoxin system PemK/MazF family toxin [Aquicella lusitana]|uniref:mRNA interferase n=1 Tax=Aquicella lusitana TaxID=254246 RepID=A0A370GE88_9COXI|nr:type II toxin-antitoxin system PemK/MazF family toxin [Aquicella lusitana]RDI42095.1 mRNA interferase MazF [Aquicella lusitana]VVC74398.1 mRNA interferase MazF9 [Aquicella lusitana]
MNRGEVYWIDLNPTKGSEINKQRPCVIVSATPINRARSTVVVVPLSTAARPRPPIVVEVTCLGKQVVAICDQIRTVDKSRLLKSAGNLSAQEMDSLDESLRQVLSL